MNLGAHFTMEAMIENMKDVISQTDDKGVVVYLSPSCAKVLGYSHDKLMGTKAFEYIHADDLERVIKLFQEGIEKKQDNRIEYRFRHAQGHYLWLETTGKVILDTEGKVVGAVFSSRDITDRKKLEDRHHSFFDLSMDLLGIANMEGYFVDVNKAWTQKLGWSREVLLNKPYISFVHPDDREETIKKVEQLLAGNKIDSFVNRYISKDGFYQWILWNSTPDTSQQLIYFVARDVTKQIGEKNELENKVTENESLLRSTIDNIQGVVYHCKNDDVWTMEYLSQGCQELTGYSPEELINNSEVSFSSIVLEQYRSQIMSLSNAAYEHEYEIRAKNGELKWVLDRGKTICLEDGTAVRQEGILSDITALKSLERESNQLKEQLRMVTENISEVVWLRSPDKSRIIFVNPAFEEVWGITCGELYNNPMVFMETIHEEDQPMVQAAYEQFKKNNHFDMNYRIIRPDGELRWVHVKSREVRNDQEEIVGHVGSAVDITERKLLEDKILESKKLYQSVVDTQQEMICRYRPDTTITFANEAYCRVFGKKPVEMVGKKFLEFMPPEYHEEELASLQRLSPEHPSYTREFQVSLPDGRVAWQQWVDVGIFNASGELIVIQGTGHDITERKQAEIEARHQAQRSAALLQISSHLNAELEPEKVKHIICGETCSALHVNMSAYLTYDNVAEKLQLAASVGIPEDVMEGLKHLSWNKMNALIRRQQGSVGIIPNPDDMPEFHCARVMMNHGINWAAYAHVERDGMPLGVLLAMDDKIAGNADDNLKLLEGIANHAASALTNARLFQESQNRLNQVQALRNIDMAITGSLDLRVILQVVLDEVTKMLQTDAAAILRLDPHSGTLRYEHWCGFRSKDILHGIVPLGVGFGGKIALDRQAIHIKDLQDNEKDQTLPSFMLHEGFVAYYGVPLIAKGTVLGVLEVFHRKKLASNGEWLAFLETLAGQAAIAVDNAELFSKLEHSNVSLLQAYDATIEGWAHALDLKDEETEEHSQRVTELTMHIARKVGIQDEDLAHIRRGALLHDIGKMGIPDSILLKTGKLTEEEWAMMRLHPVYAFEMLSSIEYLRPALDIPYCHHEKWDGSGYPRGLKGNQIPLAARIFALVDVYDALTSDRPYRKAWSKEKTLELIREESDKHFDPDIVRVFIDMMDHPLKSNKP